MSGKTEVPGLTMDISQAALAAGLEMNLFQLKGAIQEEFYFYVPIGISVTGGYHQLGEFISGIVALPRIVTTHNINIIQSEGTLLSMSATAQTYRTPDEKWDGLLA